MLVYQDGIPGAFMLVIDARARKTPAGFSDPTMSVQLWQLEKSAFGMGTEQTGSGNHEEQVKMV